MTKEEVVQLMKSSKNSNEWNLNCDKVKKAFGNNYPAFWYETIILSGLLDSTLGKGSSEIKIHTINPENL